MPAAPTTPRERLAALQLELPELPAPLASYQPLVVSDGLLVTSGVLPRRDGRIVVGRLGESLTVAQGVEAAQLATLSLLATLEAGAGGLERVRQLLLLSVFVRCAPDFSRQPEVADGASKLLVDVLGPAGTHSRVAVGVAELPLEACLELQLTARI